MTFSEALAAIKTGFLVSRVAWHGEIFVYLEKPSDVMISDGHPLAGVFPDGHKAPHQPYLARKSIGGTIEQWNPCDSDLLADDWALVAV